MVIQIVSHESFSDNCLLLLYYPYFLKWKFPLFFQIGPIKESKYIGLQLSCESVNSLERIDQGSKNILQIIV